MGYTLTPTTKAPILDELGAPVMEGTCSVDIESTDTVRLSAVASALYLEGFAVGESDVTITPNGAVPVLHPVTVEPDPFDWTLGDPIPK